ncbi:hypothetical protein [Acidicapsa acidisoli]|uniref:hypothetical protein n=1 Tax=Acidicapsa acidisoli TaxID=1615681 RepID=UPI0021DFA655|nr:hypothetical protein [Acidicapsa acidisoli]
MAGHSIVDHSKMKLGRRHVKKDSRTLRLGKYLKDGLAAPPEAKDWTKGIASWGMMLNDVHGDCTIAAAAHAVQVWSANTKGEKDEVTLPDSVVLSYFEKWDGYKPSDPNTDAGGVELDVLNNWQKASFEQHKLIAYADAAYANLEEIRQAITLFGGVYIGLALPMTAKTQAVWDVVPNGGDDAKPGSWGGHAVFVPKYDAHSFTCITWGALKQMTVAFWKEYVDEAHALLSHDWLEQKGAPSGFDLDELKADLGRIK